jgi:hypothetical protein
MKPRAMRATLLAIALVVCFTTAARADESRRITINITNGDRLSGEFVSLAEDVVQLNSSYGERISIHTDAR